jgi:hypothetical protein
MRQGSSVGMVTGYRLDDRGSIPDSGKDLSLCHHVQAGFTVHPASYTMVTGDYFPGGKAAGARI